MKTNETSITRTFISTFTLSLMCFIFWYNFIFVSPRKIDPNMLTIGSGDSFLSDTHIYKAPTNELPFGDSYRILLDKP